MIPTPLEQIPTTCFCMRSHYEQVRGAQTVPTAGVAGAEHHGERLGQHVPAPKAPVWGLYRLQV